MAIQVWAKQYGTLNPGSAIEIRSEIIFSFNTQLSHMYTVAKLCSD